MSGDDNYSLPLGSQLRADKPSCKPVTRPGISDCLALLSWQQGMQVASDGGCQILYIKPRAKWRHPGRVTGGACWNRGKTHPEERGRAPMGGLGLPPPEGPAGRGSPQEAAALSSPPCWSSGDPEALLVDGERLPQNPCCGGRSLAHLNVQASVLTVSPSAAYSVCTHINHQRTFLMAK